MASCSFTPSLTNHSSENEKSWDKQDQVIRYVAEGLRIDIDEIIAAFAELGSYEFSDFSELWVQRKFSLIFMGKETDDELREFTGESFMMALSHMMTSTSLRFQVGGFFLLYCLFIKQPAEPKQKIRISLEQWHHIHSLKEMSEVNGDYCVSYIFEQLVLLRAFTFASLPRLMGPSVTLSSEAVSLTLEDLNKMRQPLKEFLESGSLQRLSALHQRYDMEKSELPNIMDSDLNMLKEDVTSTMADHFEMLLTSKSFDLDFVKRLLKGKESLGPPDDFDDQIGVRRAFLKEKQFSTVSLSRFDSHYKELLQSSQGESDSDENGIEKNNVVCEFTSELENRGDARQNCKLLIESRGKKNKGLRKRKTKGRPKFNTDGVNDLHDVDDPINLNVPKNADPPCYYPNGRKVPERCKRKYYEYDDESDDEEDE